MADTRAFLELGRGAFVVLTTFRKTGVGVATTVWLVRDDDSLLVSTTSDTGKVKRIRNDGRVELQASGRMGKVVPGAVALAGHAEIVGDAAAHPELVALFRKKYRAQWKFFMLLERTGRRRDKRRIVIRITPA